MNGINKTMAENGMLFMNLRDTSVDGNDYQISVASFLVMKGKYEEALSILNELVAMNNGDTSFVNYLKGVCYYYLNNKLDAKAYFEKAYEGKGDVFAGYRLGRILLESEKDQEITRGISLVRRAAFLYDLDAMIRLAKICHDDYKCVRTQDRDQEKFWRESIVTLIKKCGDSVYNHAWNKVDGKYDRTFPKDEIEADFALASALGVGVNKR